MRTFLVTSIFLVVTLTVAPAADYPDHPIRLIVPQAPGSATDNAARLIGAVLSRELGQQFIIDNRPGGALTIGLDLVAKSPPDGYTIGMGPIGPLAITRHRVGAERPAPTPPPTWWRTSPATSTAPSSRSPWSRAGICCWRCRHNCRS